MIKFESVTKIFGEVKALVDVSFQVEKGEFVFITGPSGSGKTTILRLILRELKPDRGKIVFDGHDITKLKKGEVPYLRRQIGAVFQDFKLLPDRTVYENIAVSLAVSDIDRSDWNKRISQVLNLVGLSERRAFFPAQLAGGELQRTSLARALVRGPKILLADEPTGNLDPKTGEGVVELLFKANEAGNTIIMATHNDDIVNKAGKRVISLKEGKVIKDEKKGKYE